MSASVDFKAVLIILQFSNGTVSFQDMLYP